MVELALLITLLLFVFTFRRRSMMLGVLIEECYFLVLGVKNGGSRGILC